MPPRAIAPGVRPRSVSPRQLIVPLNGTRPEIALNSVVLPAPFRPTTETNSPSPTWIETFSSACALP